MSKVLAPQACREQIPVQTATLVGLHSSPRPFVLRWGRRQLLWANYSAGPIKSLRAGLSKKPGLRKQSGEDVSSHPAPNISLWPPPACAHVHIHLHTHAHIHLSTCPHTNTHIYEGVREKESLCLLKADLAFLSPLETPGGRLQVPPPCALPTIFHCWPL